MINKDFFTHTKLVGVTQKNDKNFEIQNILPLLKVNGRIYCIRDYSNKYDSNAIKVYYFTKNEGLHIGYIKRELSCEIAPFLDSHIEYDLIGAIEEITGGNGNSFGCNIRIWIEDPEEPSYEDIEYFKQSLKQEKIPQQHQPTKNNLLTNKIMASLFIIALSLFIIVFAIIYKSDIKNNDTVDKSLITFNEYNDLEIGMSKIEVYDIVGSFGTQLSEVGKITDEYYAEVYEYEGYGEAGANAVLTFVNGELESKTQYGLEYYFSDEEVKEVNTPKQSPISIDDLKFSFNILPPNLIGTVYVEATYTNNTSFPITSLSLKYLRKDENEVSYLTYYSTVMPGDTSAKFDSFGPETQLLTDIELIECSITLTNELNEKIYINYDYKLNTYKVY